MIVVIDNSVFFSLLKRRNSKTISTLFRDDIVFLAPNFLIVELFRHHDKLFEGSEDEIIRWLNLLIERVTFINVDNISLGAWAKAFLLCKDVDENDTAYIAVALEMDASFWTFDKKLKNGLRKKGFRNFFDG